MSDDCVHSCRGLCNFIRVAEKREGEALREYEQYLSVCDYPEVRALLGELIRERKHALDLLKAKRAMLQSQFNTLDDIMGSFQTG